MTNETNESTLTTVTARDPQSGNEATVEIDLGQDLNDAVSKFGEELVFDYYQRQAVVQAQAAIRGRLRADKSKGEIQGEMTQWEPGKLRRSGGSGKSTLEKATSAFENMTEAQQREFLEQLRSKMQPE